MEDHLEPFIGGQAIIRTGTLFDPPDKVGLASLSATLLRSGGAAGKTADQINQQLENLAASVESTIGPTRATVSFTALKENADQALGVFRDLLTAAEFRHDRIDFEKTHFTNAIAQRNEDPVRAGQREFSAIWFGKDTPYGWLEQYDTIGRISRTDLQNFYRRYYFPKNTMLAVWGDFDVASMKARLTALFEGWTSDQSPVPEFPKVKAGGTPGIYLLEKRDAKPTYLVAGHLGGILKEKNSPALEVAAYALGGGTRSRLVQRIHGRMANSGMLSAHWGTHFDRPGLFEISGTSDSISTVEAIKATGEEIEKMRAAEISEVELETAREAALHAFVFGLDRKSKILERVLLGEYYGYPANFLQQYQKALASVTRADVLRVARERFDPANLAIVVIGNPIMFGQPLDTLNPSVTKLDLTIPEPKTQAVTGDETSRAHGKQILIRAQQAAGGVEKLAAVQDFTEVSEFVVTPENGGFQAVETDRWVAPKTLRQDSTLPVGKISTYVDGTIAWISTPQGFGALGGSQLKLVQGDIFRLYIRLLLSDRFPERVVNALDNNSVQISEPSDQIVDVEFDPNTGLPARIRYDLVQAAGAPVKVMEEYTDFREISGIKIPHKVLVTRGGQKFADVTVTDFKINSGLQARELMRRQ